MIEAKRSCTNQFYLNQSAVEQKNHFFPVIQALDEIKLICTAPLGFECSRKLGKHPNKQFSESKFQNFRCIISLVKPRGVKKEEEEVVKIVVVKVLISWSMYQHFRILFALHH